MQEQEIIELLLQKDEGGMQAMITHYGPLLRYVIAPILSNPQDREDCFSEVVMRIWDKVSAFDEARGSWTAWLTAVARNAALNYRRSSTPNSAETIPEAAPSSEPSPEEQLLLESCVCRIICLMAKYAVKSEEQSAVVTPAHQKSLLQSEKYIREHLAEELSLNVLAGQCNLSPGYFHRLFTQYFGKTPNRYILDCRIAAAKTGLLTGNYSIAQLAADCGFSSQSYFTYKFREATGKTPMEYRKEMLSRLKI